MIRTDITEEEVEKGYRVTKLNYVWKIMSQEDRYKKVLQYAKIRNFSQCFKEIYEFNNVSVSSIDDVEYHFNSLNDQDQIDYLLMGLLDISSINEWFDDYDELLVSTIFKDDIDKYEWYEVMPLTVITNKELDETVRYLLNKIKDKKDKYFSEYMIKGIYNYNPRLVEKEFKDLDIEEKLYIYGLGQPDY
jgi:hypothetical protein